MSVYKWVYLLVICIAGVASATAAELSLKQSTIAEYLRLQGLVESTNSATVSAQVSGRVERVLVDVGDEVSAGATLLTITSVEQYQMLTQAQAQVAAAQATLVAEQQEYDRIISLVERDLVPVAERDRAKARLDNAKAQRRSAEAAVERAEEQLSYTEVKAPYAGIVSARMVEPGELVQPGTPLLSGFDPSELRLHVDLPASYAQAAKDYQWARINGLTPTSQQVFPTVHSQSSTVRMRLILPHDSGLMPGQWQPVLVKVGEHQGVQVPLAAVYHQGELTMVRMKDNSWRAVRLGLEQDGHIEIVSGLQAGEVISYE
ncbi:efflux RND transporter periplasmic adaptor subunit [Pseudidiomarina gelatinasegens]|uniref:efflux RND transporter periplasmic adaptor subunit n=1 Tax=Pseudidiomarina gelatinasegens TaxID=2487740 RepID=UPI003A97036C